MAAAAGEVADGFSVHPMHSPEYLREVVRPAVAEGTRKRGKPVDDFTLVASCFVVSGETEAERSRSERAVRRQIAFYASTPGYRPFLEFHGELDAAKRLSALMREGRLDEMPDVVSDALLSAVRGLRSRRRPRQEPPGPLCRAISSGGWPLYDGVPPGSGRTAMANVRTVRQIQV